jgi:hypothetical protein
MCTGCAPLLEPLSSGLDYSSFLYVIHSSAMYHTMLTHLKMPANTYLVDVYTVHAASAMAANTVLRSVVAAVLPLAGQQMYQKLGYGWGTSLLGFISFLLIPIPILFLKYGERLRKHPRFQVKL